MRTESHGAVAAIDCGTNSTRLLIVAPSHPEIRMMRITRLGRGVDATGRLDDAGVAATLAVLREYRALMDKSGVRRGRLVATSAVRDAANREEFVSGAGAATGLEVEVLEGSVEGELAFAGATSQAGVPPGDAVVVDIGGGSTEIVTRSPELRCVSLDIGCVRLTERLFHHDPALSTELESARRLVASQLDGARRSLGPMSEQRTLLGLAGTVSTLGALDQGLSHYERDRIHHHLLTASSVEHWLGVLASEPAAQRAQRASIAPGREDVIVAGVLVLAQVIGVFGFDSCLVSEADLLDGIVGGLLGRS
ncbi:MAG: exopolyphosphatase [Acidimicrobiales bacterium]